MINKLKKIPKKTLQLTASKMMYSCNIQMNAVETENSLKFIGEGDFRMGPMRGTVFAESEFDIEGENVKLKKYRLEVDRLGFYENYEIGEGVIHYSNSKGQSLDISINREAFQDPLSFIFHAVSEGKNFVEGKDIPLLVGKKIESFTTQKIDGIWSFLGRSKTLAKVVEEVDRWVIDIPKIKVKLNLSEKK